MNMRRGLFRFWLIGAALFVVVVGALSFQTVYEEFTRADWYESLDKTTYEILLPLDCTNARGKNGEDYEQRDGKCWYSLTNFRRLTPEYNDMTDEVLARKIYDKAGIYQRPPPTPWKLLAEIIGWTLAVPLIVLALGAALFWALSGFRRSDGPANQSPS